MVINEFFFKSLHLSHIKTLSSVTVFFWCMPFVASSAVALSSKTSEMQLKLASTFVAMFREATKKCVGKCYAFLRDRIYVSCKTQPVLTRRATASYNTPERPASLAGQLSHEAE